MGKRDRQTGGAREISKRIGKARTSVEGSGGCQRNVELAICWCKDGELASRSLV